MASPNFDALHLQHAKRIPDYVTTAAGDGAFTSAERSIHLNNAIRRFIEFCVGSKTYNPINAYVISSPTVALASNKISLTSNLFTGGEPAWILSIYNTTTTAVLVQEVPKDYIQIIEASINQYLTASTSNQFWYIDEGTITVLGAGATNTIKVRYVKKHIDLIAGFTSDILIPSQYWNLILDYALIEALNNKPTSDIDITRIKGTNDVISKQEALIAGRTDLKDN